MKVRVNASMIPAGLPANPAMAVAFCTLKATQRSLEVSEADGWVELEILGGEPADLAKLKAAGIPYEELPGWIPAPSSSRKRSTPVNPLGLAAPYGTIFAIIILIGIMCFWLIFYLPVDALRNSIALSGE